MKLSEYLMHFVGRPYVWCGNGSGQYGGGFDCSGLVIEGLWALGILPSKDLTAQGIHDALIKSGWRNPYHTITREDDILFFGKDEKAITHVAVAIDNVLMIEAGISLEDIHQELASSHVIDKKVKQEKMA